MILTIFLPCLAPSQLGGVSLGTACYGIGYYTWLPVLDLLLDIGKILISVLSYKGPHKLSLIGRRRSWLLTVHPFKRKVCWGLGMMKVGNCLLVWLRKSRGDQETQNFEHTPAQNLNRPWWQVGYTWSLVQKLPTVICYWLRPVPWAGKAIWSSRDIPGHKESQRQWECQQLWTMTVQRFAVYTHLS